MIPTSGFGGSFYRVSGGLAIAKPPGLFFAAFLRFDLVPVEALR